MDIHPSVNLVNIDAPPTLNIPPVAFIDSILPNPTLDDEIVSFIGHGVDDGTIERYVWISSIDGEIHNSTVSASFTNSSLSPGNHTIYFKVQDNYGIWSDEVYTTLEILKYSDNDSIPDKEDDEKENPIVEITLIAILFLLIILLLTINKWYGVIGKSENGESEIAGKPEEIKRTYDETYTHHETTKELKLSDSKRESFNHENEKMKSKL
jgi:hypothetical protein